MRSRARLALAFGVFLALLGLLSMEFWQRSRENGGRVQVVTDPIGLKYSLRGDHPSDGGRGWHEGMLPLPKAERQRNLVFVGDSLTFGVGVSPRESWPGALMEMLDDRHLKLYNFGVAGYDAEQVASMVESRVTDFEPDLLIWGAYVNDMVPTYMLYGADNGDSIFVGTSVPRSAQILPEPLALLLVQHSALFRRLQGTIYARNVDRSEALRPFPGWYERQIDRIAGWARNKEVPLLVLAIAPHILANADSCPQNVSDPGFCSANLASYRYMTGQFRDRELQWVDGLAAYQSSGKPSYFLPSSQDQDHPNAQGHRVLAEAFLPLLRQALSTDPPQRLEEGRGE